MLAVGVMLMVGCARETRVLRFWIAPDAPPVLVAPAEIASYEEAVHTITAIMVREFELPLSGPLSVFVYPTREAYADGLVSTGRLAPDQATKIAAYAVAVTEHGRLFINDEGMRDLPRSEWLAMIAHELAHHAQYQLSGGRRGRSEQWLREGMADWVACQVLDSLGRTTFRQEREHALREIAAAWPELASKRVDLVELGRPRGWEARHLQPDGHLVYRLAFLLTDDLIRQHRWPRLLDYFRAFAESDERFDEFQRAFGESLERFGADALARLRNDLVRREG
ncbi:MAG: hypothetical protein HYR50_08510 [Candidatus Rokubacteria bacterium]|nr:hypothetical protein [Candidatus Rokubacteria bacterium]